MGFYAENNSPGIPRISYYLVFKLGSSVEMRERQRSILNLTFDVAVCVKNN